MEKLTEILEKHNLNGGMNHHFGTDKENPHAYCSLLYDELFLEYKEKKIDIVEVGIHRGASLKLWHEYFTNASILGLDNCDHGSINNAKDLERVEIKLVNGYDGAFVETLPKFDILIDDGPHTKESQISFLNLYIPKMKENGILIIEDIMDENYISDFVSAVPEHLNYEIVDLREKSGDPYSLLFIVRN